MVTFAIPVSPLVRRALVVDVTSKPSSIEEMTLAAPERKALESPENMAVTGASVSRTSRRTPESVTESSPELGMVIVTVPFFTSTTAEARYPTRRSPLSTHQGPPQSGQKRSP